MLFTPFTLRSLTFRNRIGVSPMCQYSAVDGVPGDWHFQHIGALATGGAALVIMEATAVLPEGRISPHDLGLWDSSQVLAFARITEFVKSQGAIPGIQLAHAGRKASTRRPWEGTGAVPAAEGGWQVLGPDTEPFAPNYPTPVACTNEDIGQIIQAFADAAMRALAAGFEVIELHAAHGYLLHEFLSPLSNSRTDQWGGSFENRTRLTMAVARAVRGVWPSDFPLFVRISATDWVEGGWSLEDSVRLVRELRAVGVDLIDCSSGGNLASAKIAPGPGYQVPFSHRIRQEAGIATAAVGLITDPKQAEEIVASGSADMVLLAREMLRNPRWPLLAAHALGADAPWPPQYVRARPVRR